MNWGEANTWSPSCCWMSYCLIWAVGTDCGILLFYYFYTSYFRHTLYVTLCVCDILPHEKRGERSMERFSISDCVVLPFTFLKFLRTSQKGK